jgi:hypothetical protein
MSKQCNLPDWAYDLVGMILAEEIALSFGDKMSAETLIRYYDMSRKISAEKKLFSAYVKRHEEAQPTTEGE